MNTTFESAVAALVLGVVSSAAAAAVIDFDVLESTAFQTIPLSQFTEDGFTFQVTYSHARNSDGPAIFDTTCVGYTRNCNGDNDLVPATQG